MIDFSFYVRTLHNSVQTKTAPHSLPVTMKLMNAIPHGRCSLIKPSVHSWSARCGICFLKAGIFYLLRHLITSLDCKFVDSVHSKSSLHQDWSIVVPILAWETRGRTSKHSAMYVAVDFVPFCIFVSPARFDIVTAWLSYIDTHLQDASSGNRHVFF